MEPLGHQENDDAIFFPVLLISILNSLFLEKNNVTFVFFLLVSSECLSIFQKVALKEFLEYD